MRLLQTQSFADSFRHGYAVPPHPLADGISEEGFPFVPLYHKSAEKTSSLPKFMCLPISPLRMQREPRFVGIFLCCRVITYEDLFLRNRDFFCGTSSAGGTATVLSYTAKKSRTFCLYTSGAAKKLRPCPAPFTKSRSLGARQA